MAHVIDQRLNDQRRVDVFCVADEDWKTFDKFKDPCFHFSLPAKDVTDKRLNELIAAQKASESEQKVDAYFNEILEMASGELTEKMEAKRAEMLADYAGLTREQVKEYVLGERETVFGARERARV